MTYYEFLATFAGAADEALHEQQVADLQRSISSVEHDLEQDDYDLPGLRPTRRLLADHEEPLAGVDTPGPEFGLDEGEAAHRAAMLAYQAEIDHARERARRDHARAYVAVRNRRLRQAGQ